MSPFFCADWTRSFLRAWRRRLATFATVAVGAAFFFALAFAAPGICVEAQAATRDSFAANRFGKSDLIFEFKFSRDSPTPGTNRCDWRWDFAENGNAPKVTHGCAEFSAGGMRTTEDVDFDCNEFLVTFEISSVKNESKPAAVVAFGNAKFDAPGFCVEVTQTSVALVDRRTNSTVVTAKNLRLMSPAFRRISILNKPDGSAVFINGSCVAQSDEHVSGGVSAQRFCVGCTPALGRSSDDYDWLKARVRHVYVASAVHELAAAEIANADAETHDFFPANALGKSELVFNADFSSDDAAPRLNPRKWRWEYLRGASPRIDGNACSAEFSAGGAVTESDVPFDCSAFLVTFEIASVKNVSPGAGVVLGFSSLTDGNLAETPGFYVKVTADSVALESQETRETLVEARGLDLTEGVFKRISVLNKPGASAIYVNGRRVALSKNFLAGNSEQRFRIGAAYGRPSRVSPESYENLKARLRDLAVFSGAGTPDFACEVSSKKIVRKRQETAPFAIVTDSSPVAAERRFFDGSTELHRACARGDITRVKRLLAAGAVPAGADRISRTPLHWLCQNASVIPLETFTQVAEALIAVDREVPFMCDYAGRAPIHVLCNDGEFAYARALISLDPRQVNFGDRENRTPLHCAVEAADEAFVDFLLQNGADCDAETVAGTTPLEIAFAQHNRTLAGRLRTSERKIPTATRSCIAFAVPCRNSATTISRKSSRCCIRTRSACCVPATATGKFRCTTFAPPANSSSRKRSSCSTRVKSTFPTKKSAQR